MWNFSQLLQAYNIHYISHLNIFFAIFVLFSPTNIFSILLSNYLPYFHILPPDLLLIFFIYVFLQISTALWFLWDSSISPPHSISRLHDFLIYRWFLPNVLFWVLQFSDCVVFIFLFTFIKLISYCYLYSHEFGFSFLVRVLFWFIWILASNC